MSSAPSEATPNRKERRARARPSVKAQRLGNLMHQASANVAREEGEPDAHYFRRLRKLVVRVQTEQQRAKRKAAHDARLTRRNAARAARRKSR